MVSLVRLLRKLQPLALLQHVVKLLLAAAGNLTLHRGLIATNVVLLSYGERVEPAAALGNALVSALCADQSDGAAVVGWPPPPPPVLPPADFQRRVARLAAQEAPPP